MRAATRVPRSRQRQHDHARPLPGLPRHHHALRHHRDRALERRRRSADAAHAADGRHAGLPVRHVLGDRPGVSRRRRGVQLWWARAHERQPVPGAATGGTLTIADRITAVGGRHPDAPAERPGHDRRLHRHRADPDHDRGNPARTSIATWRGRRQPHRHHPPHAGADRAETAPGRSCLRGTYGSNIRNGEPARSGSICRSSPISTTMARRTRQ